MTPEHAALLAEADHYVWQVRQATPALADQTLIAQLAAAVRDLNTRLAWKDAELLRWADRVPTWSKPTGIEDELRRIIAGPPTGPSS